MSDEYAEEYVRNWTTIWTNILIGRNGGMEENTLTNRDGMQKYLRDSLVRNKPYDRMVHELVSATGDTQPGGDEFNGAANFLAGKLDEMRRPGHGQNRADLPRPAGPMHPVPQPSVQRLEAKPLLGDERLLPPDAGRCGRYLGHRSRASRASWSTRISAAKANDPAKAEIYYELRNGLMKVAYPVFVDGTEINPSGYLQDVNRRKELADLIVRVRVDAQGDRQSHVGPFPGLRLHQADRRHGPAQRGDRTPSCSITLCQEFAKSSFDLKELMRWIALSRSRIRFPAAAARATKATTRSSATSRSSRTSTSARCGPKSCTNR